MDHYDVVVVGGSAAGLTAAVTSKRHYPDKSVLLVRKEKLVPIPCGIPYIYGTVGSPEKNIMPDTPLEKMGVDIRVNEVTDIDISERQVLLAGGNRVGYEKLVLATGSMPMVPPIPGREREGVYTVLKDVEYLSKLQKKVEKATNVVVIGCGFIGIEFADEINKLGGKNVTIVEMLRKCLMLSYDEEFCDKAENMMRERGVKIMTSEKVVGIEGRGAAEHVLLDNGQKLPADIVLVGIGVKPNTDLAVKAGLNIGLTGSIEVDRTMRTTDPNIFAVGDCAEKHSFFGGKPSPLKLASIATHEARIAGANLFETRRENIGTVGVWSTAIGDFAFATAGLTEKQAREMGYKVVIGRAKAPNRHPGGMPGMVEMEMKLVFDKRTGQLLGGQAMGDKAAGEVINMVSACVQNKADAEKIAMFQTGTHPALTASPVAYQFVNAAETAISQMLNE
ncbi:MAG: FAD-dependent oxidoreductase [Planctomycetota bacterium]|nr:FAD-dependent oxidoreductase [Planctomycetota bacterium]